MTASRIALCLFALLLGTSAHASQEREKNFFCRPMKEPDAKKMFSVDFGTFTLRLKGKVLRYKGTNAGYATDGTSYVRGEGKAIFDKLESKFLLPGRQPHYCFNGSGSKLFVSDNGNFRLCLDQQLMDLGQPGVLSLTIYVQNCGLDPSCKNTFHDRQQATWHCRQFRP